MLPYISVCGCELCFFFIRCDVSSSFYCFSSVVHVIVFRVEFLLLFRFLFCALVGCAVSFFVSFLLILVFVIFFFKTTAPL